MAPAGSISWTVFVDKAPKQQLLLRQDQRTMRWFWRCSSTSNLDELDEHLLLKQSQTYILDRLLPTYDWSYHVCLVYIGHIWYPKSSKQKKTHHLSIYKNRTNKNITYINYYAKPPPKKKKNMYLGNCFAIKQKTIKHLPYDCKAPGLAQCQRLSLAVQPFLRFFHTSSACLDYSNMRMPTFRCCLALGISRLWDQL